jgi:DNA-directed RNA polymerase III subunit RPC6
MASSKAEIAAWKEELYAACIPFTKDNPRLVFRQADLFDLDIVPNNDIQTLLNVAQQLLDEKLFKAVHDIHGIGWILRTVDEAKKYIPSPFKFSNG